jgi:orotate phosphoribosyltransferase-like protein
MPRPFVQGHTKSGGRKKGSRNKSTVLRLKAEHEARTKLEQARLASWEEIEAASARMHTMTPLEVMLTGMHLKLGRGDIEGATKIAEAAAPYTSAKLVASEVRVQHSIEQRSDEEVALEMEMLRAKIARSKELPPQQIEGTAHTVEEQAQDIPTASCDPAS